MVFYRKYRPQTLDDLLGQQIVKNTLKKAFEAGQTAHAYLFAGPRGSGKTSTARILAKMINCESSTNIPCNICASCTSITDGSSLDLIEIDAASNRGIDDIRSLRENIKLSPTSSKKKVYIIDEVHMLTTEAFNALLKTLEEPPAHVLFILATTEMHKIPQTILSRVQTLAFHQATLEDLTIALKNVAQKEEIKAEDEALTLIAKKAEGSFRDGLKLLDQLSSVSKEVSKSLVEQNLKSGSFEDITALIESLSQKDTKKSLEIVGQLDQKGINFKEFTNSLIEVLRAMLLILNGAGEAVKDDLGSKNYPVVSDLSKLFSSQQLLKTIEVFAQSLQNLKFTPIPSLPLELAIVESSIEESAKVFKTPVQESPVFVAAPMPESKLVPTEQPVSSVPDDDVITEEVMLLKDKWQFILETIKPYNYSLEALLRQAKIVSSEDGSVILEVPYSFHQRILQAPKSRNLLESVLSDVLGKAAKVNTVIGKRPVRVEEIANVELAADDEIIRVAAEIFNS